MAAWGQIANDVHRLEKSFATVCQAMTQLIQAVEGEAQAAGVLAPNGLDAWKAVLNNAIREAYPGAAQRSHP